MSIWYDLTASNFDGFSILYDGPNFVTTNNVPAMYFDGVSDRLLVANNYTLSDSSKISNNFTYEIWCSPEDFSQEIDPQSTGGTTGLSGQKFIVHPSAVSNSNSSSDIGISIGTNGVSVYEFSGLNHFPCLLSSELSLSNTNFSHVAIVVEDKTPKLYVNGIYIKDGLKSLKTTFYAQTKIIGGGSAFYDQSGSVTPINGHYGEFGYFKGRIAQLKVHRCVLSSQQLLNSYEKGLDNNVYYTQSGRLITWGFNDYFQTGSPKLPPGSPSFPYTTKTVINAQTAQVSGNGKNWFKISNGAYHSGGIKTDGSLWMWGRNDDGQLGQNDTLQTSELEPKQVFGSERKWKSISCGGYHTAAIKVDRSLWTWGNNFNGQLGDNTVIYKSSPVQTVAGGNNWDTVSSGGGHTAAIKTDGTLWLWGRSDYGQLGDNNTIKRSSPVQTISGGSNWKQVSCGESHTAAIKTDGRLWLWGKNNRGQLGIGSTGARYSPTQVVTLGTNWKQVSCGEYHTAAIKTDGTLWAWGYNLYGQLGDNTVTYRSSPVQTVAGGANWSAVSCSLGTGTVLGSIFGHTAAIKTDGTLWTWGSNRLGEGMQGYAGNTYDKSSPVQTTLGGSDWVDVSCGGYHTSGIKKSLVNYDLYAIKNGERTDSAIFDEGENAIFAVDTQDLPDGNVIYWTLSYTSDLTANDFVESENSGSLIINSNFSAFAKMIEMDQLTEGTESSYVYLRSNSITGPVITSKYFSINDTSKSPQYELSPNVAIVDRGDTVSYNVKTTNVPDGTTLYWTNSGTTDQNDFDDSTDSGSFIVRLNSAKIQRPVKINTEPQITETIQLQLRTDSTVGPVVANSTGTVIVPGSTCEPYQVDYFPWLQYLKNLDDYTSAYDNADLDGVSLNLNLGGWAPSWEGENVYTNLIYNPSSIDLAGDLLRYYYDSYDNNLLYISFNGGGYTLANTTVIDRYSVVGGDQNGLVNPEPGHHVYPGVASYTDLAYFEAKNFGKPIICELWYSLNHERNNRLKGYSNYSFIEFEGNRLPYVEVQNTVGTSYIKKYQAGIFKVNADMYDLQESDFIVGISYIGDESGGTTKIIVDGVAVETVTNIGSIKGIDPDVFGSYIFRESYLQDKKSYFDFINVSMWNYDEGVTFSNGDSDYTDIFFESVDSNYSVYDNPDEFFKSREAFIDTYQVKYAFIVDSETDDPAEPNGWLEWSLARFYTLPNTDLPCDPVPIDCHTDIELLPPYPNYTPPGPDYAP